MEEFNAVIGYESIKRELERIVDMMVNPGKYKKLGVNTTRGLIINGNPGLGKTLMAKCLISASKRSAFTIRKDIPDGSFIEFIKTVFNMAIDRQPSIILLDDLDKFSNEDIQHVNSEEFITIQSCIDECKDKEVFILATTNDLDCIPSSLLRTGRFDKRIDIDAPEKEDAKKIIKFYLSKKSVEDNIDIDVIARLLNGGSCADLETVINEAGVFTGYENRDKISMNDIIRAFLRVVYKAPETIDDTSKPIYKQYAVHEAGHALVSELLEPGTVSLATIRSNEGGTGGFVSMINCDNYFSDIKHMENRVKGLLAGKVAQEVVLGSISTGASLDIDRAIRIVGRFYEDYVIDGYLHTSRGLKLTTDGEREKKMLVANDLQRYEREVREILVNNRDKLDKLTNLLIEKDTLIFPEIVEIVRAQ